MSAWLRAVELSCDRAGLLLCSDYATAVTCIAREDIHLSKLTVDERVAELTKFAMSDEYSILRGKLGIKTYDDSNDVPQQ